MPSLHEVYQQKVKLPGAKNSIGFLGKLSYHSQQAFVLQQFNESGELIQGAYIYIYIYVKKYQSEARKEAVAFERSKCFL